MRPTAGHGCITLEEGLGSQDKAISWQRILMWGKVMWNCDLSQGSCWQHCDQASCWWLCLHSWQL